MNDASGFSMEYFVHHKPCTAPNENLILPRGSFATEQILESSKPVDARLSGKEGGRTIRIDRDNACLHAFR